ncbi:MAG: arsenate reductase (glutaredoxin) [Crocinitomicaceae bacterium]|nr:arsenate reductase (glutaredoxin) [Crocinitomicaceae bacterium]
MKIYHNPRCAKSRETLNILKERGFNPEEVLYMKEPLGVPEMEDILNKLGVAPSALLRKKEKLFKEMFQDKELSEQEWLLVLLEHPNLMERPIVINKDKAVIGRPPENVLSIV